MEDNAKQFKGKACIRARYNSFALIITVVIMIILAAVTINVTLGDGGLVDQAKHAAEQTAMQPRQSNNS